MPNIAAIQDRAALGSQVTATLSPESLFLLLDLLEENSERYSWDELSDAQWDTAQDIIANAVHELNSAT